ncbi:MAG TPA: hypothetical protein VGQ68_02310 [Gaiellaceae bacterium]|jgi:hypothetical protein|nr:hypothetical protein [Gaiellaceae bacterium]
MSIVALATLVPIATAGATVTPPVPVKNGPADEFAPAASSEYLVWAQSPHNSTRSTVWAQHIAEAPFRVSPRSVRAYPGGIDGTRLVYQRVRGEQSNLAFFDLATRRQTSAPAGVNTRQWEWDPSISGDWLLFGRTTRTTESILLWNLTTRRRIKLSSIRTGRGRRLTPGYVNGNFAVWERCGTGRVCDVYRYDITLGTKKAVPSIPGKQDYAPSVTADGTVYYGRSGRGCGASVQLVKSPLTGAEEVLYSLPQGEDFATTYPVTVPSPPSGLQTTSIYFDRIVCREEAWDIYRLDDVTPLPPPPAR